MSRRLFVILALLASLSTLSTWSARAQGPQPVDPPTPTATFGESPQPTPRSPLATTEVQHNTLYAQSFDQLWIIDPNTQTSTYIGPINYSTFDIAFSENSLYGVAYTDWLSIDPTTGNGTYIGPIGYSPNALTIASNGTAYGATGSGEFITINKTTGVGSLVGYFGSGLSSAGDLAFREDGVLFASVNRSGYSNTWLAVVNPANGAATLIGDIGFQNVFGLSFKDGVFYGVTQQGEVLQINPSTGNGTLIFTADIPLGGLTTSGKAPTVNWIHPVGNLQTYTVSSGTVALEVSATDNDSGVNRIEFWRWDAVNNQWVHLSTDYSAPYQSSVNVNTLNMEANEIDAYAFNNAGNRIREYIWINRVPPPPDANFDAWPQSGQAPLTVSFHIVSTANITSCSWNYGDTTTGTSCADYHDHTYNAAGSYTVRLTASGPGGSDTMTRTNYITVSAPSSSISGRVADSNNNPISGVTISDGAGHTTTTNSNGNYTLSGLVAGSYTITPSNSGWAFSPPSRTVNVPPDKSGQNFTATRPIDLEVTNIETPLPPICAGTSGNFTAYIRNNGTAVSGPFTIRWNVDGQRIERGYGSIAAGATSTDVYSWQNISQGQHTLRFVADVTAQIPESNENNNLQTINFTAVNCTPAPVANFEAQPQSGNAPLIVSIHNTSTGNITSCAWNYGDGQTGNSCAVYHNHTYDGAGSYTVTLTVFGPGGSDPMTRPNYITVLTRPVGIAFRPNPHGYSFSNDSPFWFPPYPFPPASLDFTIEDMRVMFGDDAVCSRIVGLYCVPKKTALEAWDRAARYVGSLGGGRCLGFSVTSLRFFKGLDYPSRYQSGANVPYDLNLFNVRRHISYYQALSAFDPLARDWSKALKASTPITVLTQLRNNMTTGSSPLLLSFYDDRNLKSGHTVVPYLIEDTGNGMWHIRVYDSNRPGDASRYVTIDTRNNTWSYDHGSILLGAWSGDDTTHSLATLSLERHLQNPQCYWCTGAGARSESQSQAIQTSFEGKGHLRITDAQGRRIGFVNDQLVNEIPNAFSFNPPGGLGIPREPIYYLPPANPYTITIDGQTLTWSEVVSATQIGPGYAVAVKGITLNPASNSRMIVSSDGKQFTYRSNTNDEVALTLALDTPGESDEFVIKGADIRSGERLTLMASTGNGQLVFNSAQASGGLYDVEIGRANATVNNTFLHSGIQISPGDTHYISYGVWNGLGSMTLSIDQHSDGTIDLTTVLDNQLPKVYLPILMHNH